MPLKRPLEPLVLGDNHGGSGMFKFQKAPWPDRAVITTTTFAADRPLNWTIDEIRKVHAWLGDVIADANAGV